MDRLAHKRMTNLQRRRRVRASISGTDDRLRLSIHFSSNNVTAQIIDDEKRQTLAQASSIGQQTADTMTQKATAVGQEIARKAKKAKVKKVVFDRGGHVYHGRVAALAEAARKGGLEF